MVISLDILPQRHLLPNLLVQILNKASRQINLPLSAPYLANSIQPFLFLELEINVIDLKFVQHYFDNLNYQVL